MERLKHLIQLYHRGVERLLTYLDLLQYYKIHNKTKAKIFEKNASDLEKGLDRILQTINKTLENLPK